MDPLAFFSAEELAVWAGQAHMDDWLRLTGLGLKLAFLLVTLLTGIHLALRSGCERLADRLYARESLAGPVGQRSGLGRLLRPLERLSDPRGDAPKRWVVDALYPIGLTLMWSVLIVPFSFFTSYVLGHERGLLTMGAGLWWTDWLKGRAMGVIFFGLLGVGLFGLARRLPRTWWVWLWGAVVGMLLVWSMLSPYRARIYHSFEPLKAGPVRDQIERLMERADLKVSHIEVMDTSTRSRHAAAYVMGDGPTKRVILGDNLVRTFAPREIGVALGHELGHEKLDHQDRTWLSLAIASLVFLVLVRLILWLAPKSRRLGLKPDADPAVLPLIMLVMLGLFLANQPLSAWLDRQEERAADAEGVALTGDPIAFCSLMVRLARTNQADVDPPAWRQWMWGHHPTIKERIGFGLRWAADHHIPVGPGAIPLSVPNQPPGVAEK